MTSVYEEKGFTDRDEYLVDLAEAHGVGLDIVYCLADVLGEEEDFDGLVIALEDVESLGSC